MTERKTIIPARLKSGVVNGYVTGAVDIYDDSKEQDQQTINAAVDSEIGTDSTSGTIKGRIKALEESIGPGGSVEEQINAKVATLDATVSQTASTDGLALQVTEVDGKLTGVTGSIAANTYDTHGAAATAKTELLGDAASDYNTLGKLEDKIQAEATARGNEDTALDGRLDTIEGLIPSQATTTNQLADKSFVNSSVSTATATYKGSKNLVSDLSLPVDATESQIATALATAISTADNNDYAFVQVPTSATTPTQIARVDRYKYNGTAWAFEYSINNSGYTAEQWAAINSGITSNLVTAFGAKYDLPSGGMPSTDMSSAVQTSLGKADTAYQKPSAGIPNTDLTSGVQSSLGKADTAYQKPSGGIPSSDMSSAVQSSLSAADSAYQLPSGGIPDTDLSSAVQTSLGKADTALQSVPTASASVLGGVKVGTNLSIDANGVVSATDTTYSDFVGSGSSHAHGLVPDPGATAGTTKYLREDGTWAVPGGSGGSDVDVNYDTINKKITKTIDGVTSDIVTAATIVEDGGGIEVVQTTGQSTTAVMSQKAVSDLVPAQASPSNQLADKNFVNSSISTATATYQGSYNLVSDLSLTTQASHGQIEDALGTAISGADSNDYSYVQIPTSDSTPTEIASVERYKFNGTRWSFEYALNNSGFTAAQWAAVNSGITSGLVAKLGQLTSNPQNSIAALFGMDSNGDWQNITPANLASVLSVPGIKVKKNPWIENTTWNTGVTLDNNVGIVIAAGGDRSTGTSSKIVASCFGGMGSSDQLKSFVDNGTISNGNISIGYESSTRTVKIVCENSSGMALIIYFG